MMEILKQMILGVCVAGILATIILSFLSEGGIKETVKTALGIGVLIAFLAPLGKNIDLIWDVEWPSLSAVAAEQSEADRLYFQTLDKKMSDYIRNEAKSLGIDCKASIVSIGEGGVYQIEAVRLSGENVSSKEKTKLMELVSEAFGLTSEQIVWDEVETNEVDETSMDPE